MTGFHDPNMHVARECEPEDIEALGPPVLPLPFGSNRSVMVCLRATSFAMNLTGTRPDNGFGVVALGAGDAHGVYAAFDVAGLRQLAAIASQMADDLQAKMAHG